MVMLTSLLRFFGFAKETAELSKFEPVYGLTKEALDEWLARNPLLRQEYEAKLKTYYLSNGRWSH